MSTWSKETVNFLLSLLPAWWPLVRQIASVKFVVHAKLFP